VKPSAHPDARQADGVPQIIEKFQVPGVDSQNEQESEQNNQPKSFLGHCKPLWSVVSGQLPVVSC
jgi:hypothetical protein